MVIYHIAYVLLAVCRRMISSTLLRSKNTRLCSRKKGSPFFIQSVRVTSEMLSSSANSCLDNNCSSFGSWLLPVLKCSLSSALTASRMHWLRACSLMISIAFEFGSKKCYRTRDY